MSDSILVRPTIVFGVFNDKLVGVEAIGKLAHYVSDMSNSTHSTPN